MMSLVAVCHQSISALAGRADATGRQSTEIRPEVAMSEKIKLEPVSRRSVLSVFGLGAAVATLAVPATVLTATEAEAVVGRPLTPMSAAGVARRNARRTYYKKKKK